jgi:hypothetical protein
LARAGKSQSGVYNEVGVSFDDDVFYGQNNGRPNQKFSGDMKGISYIKGAREWKDFISEERPSSWKELIPTIPKEFTPRPSAPSMSPVTPLPLPKPNPQPMPRA